MEKKVTRRIVGILVIVALVIILLPLLFTSGEQTSSVQVAEIKAPLQDSQDTPQPQSALPPAPVATPNPNPVMPAPALPLPAKQDAPPVVQPSQTINSLSTSANKTTDALVASALPNKTDAVTPTMDAALPALSPTNPDGDNSEAQSETVKLIDDKTTAERTDVFNPAAANQKSTYRSRLKTGLPTAASVATDSEDSETASLNSSPVIKELHNNMESSAKENGLVSKKTGWVVQLGSFKNKTNAEHLASMLRSKGYKVFTYEAKRSGQTRVCVGPEGKQASAFVLAKKIERDIKIRGIVKVY